MTTGRRHGEPTRATYGRGEDASPETPRTTPAFRRRRKALSQSLDEAPTLLGAKLRLVSFDFDSRPFRRPRPFVSFRSHDSTRGRAARARRSTRAACGREDDEALPGRAAARRAGERATQPVEVFLRAIAPHGARPSTYRSEARGARAEVPEGAPRARSRLELGRTSSEGPLPESSSSEVAPPGRGRPDPGRARGSSASSRARARSSAGDRLGGGCLGRGHVDSRARRARSVSGEIFLGDFVPEGGPAAVPPPAWRRRATMVVAVAGERTERRSGEEMMAKCSVSEHLMYGGLRK